MKATELMLGDWVFNTQNNKPEQVQEILTGNDIDYAVMLDYRDIYNEDDIEPIPLTAEILKANGFEPRDEHFYLSDDYYDIDVWQYSDGIWIVRYDCCEMNMPSEQWTISYLYELQQFMRHCKIDKTIEL